MPHGLGEKKRIERRDVYKALTQHLALVSAQETLATICDDNYSESSYLVVTIPWTPEIPALRTLPSHKALCQTSKQSQGQSPLFLLPQLSLLRFLLPLLPTDHWGKPGGPCSLSAPPSPGSHQGFQDPKVDFSPLPHRTNGDTPRLLCTLRRFWKRGERGKPRGSRTDFGGKD